MVPEQFFWHLTLHIKYWLLKEWADQEHTKLPPPAFPHKQWHMNTSLSLQQVEFPAASYLQSCGMFWYF
jgi:hypothetical protein